MKANLKPEKKQQPAEVRTGRLVHLPPDMWALIDVERIALFGVNKTTGRPIMSAAKYIEHIFNNRPGWDIKLEAPADQLEAYESLRERMKAGRPAPVLVPDDLKLNL
jgi:hypothetical protein